MRYFIYCRKSQEAEDRQVLSIESQLTNLERSFHGRSDIIVIGQYEEAFSAKSPGRPMFDEMIRRIEKGEADGIIAWAPDRLARNSIDGGRIVYLLDCGVIKDLKFSTYTFENNPQGKFMLQIMFGQSKYYSDALSENVKRGNRTKVEKGWRPSQPPLGYKTDKETKTTVPDPVHFPLVRRMYELMLTGAYSPTRIAILARDKWGFLTPKKKRVGGKPIQISTVHRILTNPFYAGIIEWEGQTFPGKHKPVVTLEEFGRVKALLRRPGVERPQKRTFAFTGLMRCGGCGLRITASHKVKRSGRSYIYYHCTRRRLDIRCRQPAVTLAAFEDQFETFLASLCVPPDIEQATLTTVVRKNGLRQEDQVARERSLKVSVDSVSNQLEELTNLRLRQLLTDEEFLRRRGELQQEQRRLLELSQQATAGPTLEPASKLISFSNSAVARFRSANLEQKRLIFQIAGSNPRLIDGKLSVQAAKPFVTTDESNAYPRMCAFIDDVITYSCQETEEARALFERLKALDASFEENGSPFGSPALTSPSPHVSRGDLQSLPSPSREGTRTGRLTHAGAEQHQPRTASLQMQRSKLRKSA